MTKTDPLRVAVPPLPSRESIVPMDYDVDYATAAAIVQQADLQETWPMADTLPKGALVLGTTGTQAVKLKIGMVAAVVTVFAAGGAAGFWFGWRRRGKKENNGE